MATVTTVSDYTNTSTASALTHNSSIQAPSAAELRYEPVVTTPCNMMFFQHYVL